MDAVSFSMLKPGHIVLAFINDPQGRNPKDRPAIVIEQLSDENGSPYYEVIGGTGEPIQSRFIKYTITLGKNGARCLRTQLDKETRFSAHWLEPVELPQAKHIMGECPAAQFNDLLLKLEQYEREQC